MPPGEYTQRLADRLAMSRSTLDNTQNLDGRDRIAADAQAQADAAYALAQNHAHYHPDMDAGQTPDGANTNVHGFASDKDLQAYKKSIDTKISNINTALDNKAGQNHDHGTHRHSGVTKGNASTDTTLVK